MNKTDPRKWCVSDILKWSRQYLSEHGIESPQLEAEWMLRDLLNYSRIEVYMNHDKPLSMSELAGFKSLLLERVKGRPLQYILGYTEFMGLKINVNPDVLIPRSETEVIVEYLLKTSYTKWKEPAILDIGTGSGNIAISLAANIDRAKILAIDISNGALKIAKENARNNDVADRIKFVQLDILQEFPEKDTKYDIIVSNPPYVGGDKYDNLPDIVRRFEPKVALHPGKDEYIFYKRITEYAVDCLSESGIMVVEIGGTYQEEEIKAIISGYGMEIVEVIQDYIIQSRGIVAKLK